jgi:probable HAF family extracellular repeat protein
MWYCAFLKSLQSNLMRSARRGSGPARPRRAARPRLEALEDRSLPSSYALTDLGTLPGSTDSYAIALNDNGQVVGNTYNRQTGKDYHAFIWDGSSMQDLGVLSEGDSSWAYGINNAGVVVGYSASPPLASSYRAFVWDSANGLRDLNDLLPLSTGWTLTFAYGINDAGQIVGRGYYNGVETSFLGQLNADATNFTVTNLLDPVFQSGEPHPLSINNKVVEGDSIFGEVAGELRVGPGLSDYHAALWQNGVSTDLGTLGGPSSYSNGINDSTQVVGYSINTATNTHAFIWDAGSGMQDLGTLGGSHSWGYGINNDGWVGRSRTPAKKVINEGMAAFLWNGGAMQDLNKLLVSSDRWNLRVAKDINDNPAGAQIVADGLRSGVGTHAILLTPQAALTATFGSDGLVTTAETLTTEQVAPLLTEAYVRWQAAGVDTSSLSNLTIRVADLTGATLGLASGHTLWLDADVAGWGWFIDPTPREDREFITPGNQGEQQRMDLLTVLAHDVGHLLGYEHAESGVMEETLAAGTRRAPMAGVATRDSDVFDRVFADTPALALSASFWGDALDALLRLEQQRLGTRRGG